MRVLTFTMFEMGVSIFVPKGGVNEPLEGLRVKPNSKLDLFLGDQHVNMYIFWACYHGGL